MTNRAPVRTRVAPSPTGNPHVGTAYQALFNKALAEAAGGSFILRIEDTDQSRRQPDSEAMIFRALRWLGLDWDEGPDVGGPHGPYRQSARTEIYREHVEVLLDKGAAYRCFCSAERLETLRAEQKAAKLTLRYDGLCAGLNPTEAAGRAGSEPHVVRLRVPPAGQTVVHDECRGDVAFDNATIDDQVLLKSDGFPTYHLANVVDDHLMEVSHVMRGEEWLNSLPKHALLYRAFDWVPPLFIHTPLLRNPDRSKFSKRRNPTSLEWYRDEGYLPEALVNFLGQLGWSHPEEKERFDYQDFVARFHWERLSLSGPVFDPEKLLHLNGLWIRSLSESELCRRLSEGGFARRGADADLLLGTVRLVQERLHLLTEFAEATEFFFETPQVAESSALVGKKANPEGVRDALSAVRDGLPATDAWDEASVEEAVRAVAGGSELKARDVFMAARVAVTGRAVSTPLFETITLLGRAETVRRLDAALALL